MLFTGLLAALSIVAGVDCQLRTITVYKSLTPTAVPVAGAPVGYAGLGSVADIYQPPQAGYQGEIGPGILSAPQLGRATPITNNPQTIVYRAVLRGAYGLEAVVTAQAGPGGVGVRYKIDARGLYGYGPFSYYVFERSVPGNMDCSALGGKLDPYLRGESPRCILSAPDTCQVGDLSGKYGRLDAVSTAKKMFVDRFSSLQIRDASFIGRRSVAIVDNTGVRLACGTFVEAEDLEYEDFD